MNARLLAAATAVVLSVTGGGAVAAPATAAGRTAALTATAQVDQAAADLSWVNWLARNDPRDNLRAAAWAALLNAERARKQGKDELSRQIIAQYVTKGYDYSRSRAELTALRNADFARRVLKTHLPEYSPHVHAAAQVALDRGTQALATFAGSGYTAAQELDRQAREADGAQAKAIDEADWKFVALLRDTDPGPQVQGAAAWALRDGATNAYLVEFFAFDWPSAASLDLQTFHTRSADNDALWRVTVRGLVATAQAAEKAALEAAGEAAVQKRAAAARAWAAVGARTAEPRSAWDEAQDLALRQAENWQRIALDAAASTNPNWAAIAGTALDTGQRWSDEQSNAAEQAEYWSDLYEMALAGELAMRPPAG